MSRVASQSVDGAVPSSTKDNTNVSKSGNLYKRGDNSKSFKRCFATIANHKLTWHGTSSIVDGITKAKKEISLEGSSVEKLADTEYDRSFCFQLFPLRSKRTYVFQASSDTDLESWVTALRKAMLEVRRRKSISGVSPVAAPAPRRKDPSLPTFAEDGEEAEVDVPTPALVERSPQQKAVNGHLQKKTEATTDGYKFMFQRNSITEQTTTANGFRNGHPDQKSVSTATMRHISFEEEDEKVPRHHQGEENSMHKYEDGGHGVSREEQVQGGSSRIPGSLKMYAKSTYVPKRQTDLQDTGYHALQGDEDEDENGGSGCTQRFASWCRQPVSCSVC